MAIDSLKSLTVNIPDWLKRLEELNGQIEQRQRDLAQLPENQSSSRSIKNRGSTESLKPKRDDAEVPLEDLAPDATPDAAPRNAAQEKSGADHPSSPVSERNSKSSHHQAHEVKATAQRRARATVRKKQKTDSMVSAEGAVPKYRSRNMIIVYYDSYVQSFFEELVKFVSSQRNLMRKAKMAAKVAQIKRLAELEMPDDEDDDGDELKPGDNLIAADPKTTAPKPKPDGPEELKLHFRSTRQMGYASRMPPGRMNMRGLRSGMGGGGGGGGGLGLPGDIWEELDKGLEFVQGMCEHGAHQFLRDGDCNDEIEKIKSRLAQTREAADKELVRVAAENPDGLDMAEPTKTRSYRPMTMRRDTGASTPKSQPKQEAPEEMEDEGIQA
ncbi:hypothetical protein F5B20DRAFT_421254 [Whalleya microplaca]|nr:hypothetical protein F5B20DRAFT_421254 [Whalleya microplaca]